MLPAVQDPGDNLLHTRRPTSTFEGFNPTHQSQTDVAAGLSRLADMVTKAEAHILGNEFPFSAGKLIVLSGGPGRGKSHLLEAFANKVIDNAPKLAEKMFLLREDLVLYTYGLRTGQPHFGNRPIVLIDDLFQRQKSASELGTANELPCLEKLILDVYQNRRLVLVATNFPFLKEICEKMRRYDTVGRTISRLEELTAGSREYALQGEDYRAVLAQRAQESGVEGFSLPGIPQ